MGQLRTAGLVLLGPQGQGPGGTGPPHPPLPLLPGAASWSGLSGASVLVLPPDSLHRLPSSRLWSKSSVTFIIHNEEVKS